MKRISVALAAFILPIIIFLGVEAHENRASITMLPYRLGVMTTEDSLRSLLKKVTYIPAPEDSDQARCLAQAVYFEARSEPLEGQLAVAQVVLNRVENPRYPSTICGVVFQNEQMRHRCQFSFACDGLSDQPFEQRAWEVAKSISYVARKGMWDDITNHATNYHAAYVAPLWSNSMLQTVSHGQHIFYRDR